MEGQHWRERVCACGGGLQLITRLRTLRFPKSTGIALTAPAGAREGVSPTLVLDFIAQSYSYMNPNPQPTLELDFVNQVYATA